MNASEILNILMKLYQVRHYSYRIPEWRPIYLLKIGISSYTYYKLTALLEREGAIKGKEIYWNILEQVIKKYERKFERSQARLHKLRNR